MIAVGLRGLPLCFQRSYMREHKSAMMGRYVMTDCALSAAGKVSPQHEMGGKEDENRSGRTTVSLGNLLNLSSRLFFPLTSRSAFS